MGFSILGCFKSVAVLVDIYWQFAMNQTHSKAFYVCILISFHNCMDWLLFHYCHFSYGEKKCIEVK
jgi:hypothetical protein